MSIRQLQQLHARPTLSRPQHWFVLLKYHSQLAYTIIELWLEAVFQVEVLSYVAYFETPWGPAFDRLGRGCAITMLFSHWIWLVAAFLRNMRGLCQMLSPTQDLPPGLTERQSTITDWRLSVVRASGIEIHPEDHHLASSATTSKSGDGSSVGKPIPSWAAGAQAPPLYAKHSTIDDWRQGLANIFGASKRESTEHASTVVVATSTR